ncbi:uncharacterized protein [Cherax quadricarinatus]
MVASQGYLTLLLVIKGTVCHTTHNNETVVAGILQGSWFSWEEGRSVNTEISARKMSGLGTVIEGEALRTGTFQYILRHQSPCFTCVVFIVRTWNILERFQSTCVSEGTLKNSEWEMCLGLSDGRTGYIMFRQDPTFLNCRPAIHGLYHFAWQNTFSFTGECNHPDATIRSCQAPGSQYLMDSQTFTINYKKCEGLGHSFQASVVFSCLGDWFVGKNHYFAVVNTKESRKEEKYRCFIRNREDDLYLGHSITPECSPLKTPENSPIRFRLSYVKHEVVPPGCFLPRNLTGDWQSTGPGEPHLTINATHIQETTWRGYSAKTSIYVCLQHRGSRYLMAKLSVEGCQTEYVCWEMVPRHHNIVRFRVTWPLIYQGYYQVCDYANFRSGREWQYHTLIADPPEPISCPIGGRFSFVQRGPSPLTKRILGGITSSPLDTYPCHRQVSDLSVCTPDRRWINIDMDLCLSLNKDGHHVDYNRMLDYRLQCVGFWHENLRSYLVTIDPSDPVSRFRCWVYQRVGLGRLVLSQSVGAACGLHQNFLSYTYDEGAAVGLNLTFSERIHDQCPIYYDDGHDPWKIQNGAVTVFRFANNNSTSVYVTTTFIIFLQDECTSVTSEGKGTTSPANRGK